MSAENCVFSLCGCELRTPHSSLESHLCCLELQEQAAQELSDGKKGRVSCQSSVHAGLRCKKICLLEIKIFRSQRKSENHKIFKVLQRTSTV